MYNSAANKKAILVLRLLVPALLVVMLALFHNSYQEVDDMKVTMIFYFAISIIWALAIKPFLMLIMKININMTKNSGRLTLNDDISIQFNESFFIEIAKETDTKINYSSIEKVTKGNKAIYIYISSIQAFILPFSIFETVAQRDDFLMFVNHKAFEKSSTLT